VVRHDEVQHFESWDAAAFTRSLTSTRRAFSWWC